MLLFLLFSPASASTLFVACCCRRRPNVHIFLSTFVFILTVAAAPATEPPPPLPLPPLPLLLLLCSSLLCLFPNPSYSNFVVQSLAVQQSLLSGLGFPISPLLAITGMRGAVGTKRQPVEAKPLLKQYIRLLSGARRVSLRPGSTTTLFSGYAVKLTSACLELESRTNVSATRLSSEGSGPGWVRSTQDDSAKRDQGG